MLDLLYCVLTAVMFLNCCTAAAGLVSLNLDLLGAPAAGSALPKQLQRFTVCSWSDSEGDERFNSPLNPWQQPHDLQHLWIDNLQQLTELSVTNALCDPHMMRRVACLPQLKHVDLRYTAGEHAVR
jgi:hypothetical protein